MGQEVCAHLDIIDKKWGFEIGLKYDTKVEPRPGFLINGVTTLC